MGLLNFVEMTTTQAASPFTLAASGKAPTFAKASIAASQVVNVTIYDETTGEGLTGYGTVNAGVLTLIAILSTVDASGNMSRTPSQSFTFSSATNAKKVWPTVDADTVAQPYTGVTGAGDALNAGALLGYVASEYITGVLGSYFTSTSMSSIRAQAVPHRWPAPGMFSGGLLQISGTPAAGGQIKVYVCESGANGLPGKIITDFGSEATPIACEATGALQFTAPTDFYVPYAPCWAVLRGNFTGATNFEGSFIAGGVIPPNSANDRLQQNIQSGSLGGFAPAMPDPPSSDWSGSGIVNGVSFHLWLKRAA